MDHAHAESANHATLSLAVAETFAFDDVPRLTAALKRGDENAFAWLHGAWSRRINGWCFALAAGRESFAHEIAQATWLRLMRHIRVLPDEAALWNWIARAARHAATDLLRKGGRYLRALRRFGEWWSDATATESDSNLDAGLLAALEAALQKLPPNERALIEARYFSGESLETIGARECLSVRAVEGRLARLRIKIRERIAAELEPRSS